LQRRHHGVAVEDRADLEHGECAALAGQRALGPFAFDALPERARILQRALAGGIAVDA
jgi:hypothetical protein